MSSNSPRRCRSLSWGLAVLALGCSRSAERFTPPDELARASLSAALEAWKEGKSPGTIDNVSPSIQFVDAERPAAQKLLDFQVLSEVASTSGRMYVVRLRLAEPEAVERARFIVVGVDPIWVFRKADFDKLSHWEHPMPNPAAELEESAEGPAKP